MNTLKLNVQKDKKKVNGNCINVSDGEKKIVKRVKKTKRARKEIACPKGFNKVGKYRCVKVLICPNGYKRTQDGCKKVIINCPTGYKRLRNTCVKSSTKCSSGFVLKKGKCQKFDQSKCSSTKCPNVTCSPGYRSHLFKYTCCPRCISCKCPKEFDPVCSTNGITFKNECDALCQGFQIRHIGTCNNPCNGKCPAFIKPVCGRNGKTYRNRCVLRSNLVVFASNGRCDEKTCYWSKR